MLIFGLTGGIASGKSTVSDMLAELGCPIIDADVLARKVVEPGRPAWREVVKQFGDGILHENGSINRERLASLIFNDHQKRHALNKCTHPYIRKSVLWEIAKNFIKGQPHVVIVSPLLFETKYALRYMRQIIVVSCTPIQQLSRLMARDGLSEEQALRRIQAQIQLATKCLWADVEIDNSRGREVTHRQVEHLVHKMNSISYCRQFIMYYVAILFALLVGFVFTIL